MTDKKQAELKEMALELGIALYARFSESEAADVLGISPATLQRRRKEGKIAFIQITERHIQYFGSQILEYLLAQTREATWQNTDTTNATSNSAITGLASAAKAPHGIAVGMTK